MTLFILTNCANVPNVEVCVRLIDGAACTYTLQGKDRDMNESEYKNQEIGEIFMRPESYGEIKKFILKQCKKSNKCNLNGTQKKLETMELRICNGKICH